MDKLVFLVQGSRPKPYKVSFEGANGYLTAFCTCPAGKKGGLFCKHIAQLLKGDCAKIVEGSEYLQELLERAQGSPLVAKAQTHKAAPPRPEQIDLGTIQSLQDLAEYTAKKLASSLLWHEYSQGDNDSAGLCVFGRKHYKNGKAYKRPTLLLSISYEPYTHVYIWNPEAEGPAGGVFTKKAMPWMVDSTNYVHFKSAASKFLHKLDEALRNQEQFLPPNIASTGANITVATVAPNFSGRQNS